MSDNKVLARAKIHFKPQRDLRKIHIPEWAEEGASGDFYTNSCNLKERSVIQKTSEDSYELSVEIILRKLLNHEGNPVFSREDKPVLMREVDPAVIGRVANEILGSADIEEAEKN